MKKYSENIKFNENVNNLKELKGAFSNHAHAPLIFKLNHEYIRQQALIYLSTNFSI